MKRRARAFLLLALLLPVAADAQRGRYRYVDAGLACFGGGCVAVPSVGCRADDPDSLIFCGPTGALVTFSESGTLADFEGSIEADGFACETDGCIGGSEIDASTDPIASYLTIQLDGDFLFIGENTGGAAGDLAILSLKLRDDVGSGRDAARIIAGKQQLWTSTTTTRDGYLAFNVALDNSLTNEVARLYTSSSSFTGDGTAPAAGSALGVCVTTSAGTCCEYGLLATAPGTCTVCDSYKDTSGAFCACSQTDTWENLSTKGSCA